MPRGNHQAHMTPEQFARNEYRDYVTYRELARTETVPAFKRILDELVQHELDDYRFWQQMSSRKEHRISGVEMTLLGAMRRLLGLTFTAKFLERHEKDAIRNYTAFLKSAEEPLRSRVQTIIDHEIYHERELINQIREERVQFLGSVVLGVNDGLIELTGALTGFAFALMDHLQVALFGLVTGVSASLSMAASAYMQARHEEGKNARTASLYTGVSYLVVVLVLVLPFFLIADIHLALAAMFLLILLMVASFSYYASVLFERNFRRQFGEMLVFSMGVAGVAFLLGKTIRLILGHSA